MIHITYYNDLNKKLIKSGLNKSSFGFLVPLPARGIPRYDSTVNFKHKISLIFDE